MSPLPDVGDMAGKTAWNDVDCVDAQVVAIANEPRCEPLGGSGDAAQAVGIERESGSIFGGSRLNLDEGKRPASARNDVHFAAGNSGPARKNSPAVQPKPHRRQCFGATAALLGLLALHLERSRARA